MISISPCKDILIIKEHKRDDAFNVSELYEAEVIKVGPMVDKLYKPGQTIYFYQKNNRQIDDTYSFIFSEDVLFIKDAKKENK